MEKNYGVKGLEVSMLRIDICCVVLGGKDSCSKGNGDMEAEHLRLGLLISSNERCDPAKNGSSDLTHAELSTRKKARPKQKEAV